MNNRLLLSLFAFIMAYATAWADNVNINVDNAANVEVTYGYDATPLALEDGFNRITTLTAADSPLTIRPANGATIESVTKNGSETLSPSGDGAYRVAIDNMMLDIVTSGGSEVETPLYNVYFNPTGNSIGHFSVTYGETTKIIDEMKYWQLPAEPITVAPLEGYMIKDFSYNPDWTGNEAINNGDGTWTFTPKRDYTMADINVMEKGITFTVDIPLKENVMVVAWTDQDCNWEAAGTFKFLELSGYGPYTAVAPENVYALDFLPAEGGSIKAITKVSANGEKTNLVYSAYVGWRSFVAEGDTFIIDATGPEVDLTVASGSEGIAADRFTVSIDGTLLSFTAENPTVKAHAGDIVTVSGAQGVELSYIYPDCGQMITSLGPVQTFRITRSGTVYCYGAELSNISINVDNAAAVIVKDRAGYGKVLELTNGNNVLSEVQNPLNITAAEGYVIKSVIVNGENIKENTNGSYTVELLEGSTLSIITAEKPSKYPVTVALAGDAQYENLVVTNDEESVYLTADANLIAAEPGAILTFAPMKGYLLESLSVSGDLISKYDEDSGIWSVTVNGPGAVSVVLNKWVAKEGSVLIDFNVDDSFYVRGIVLNEKGEWQAKLEQGINEVTKGYTINVFTSSSDVQLKEVLYNDRPMAIEANGKDCYFTVEEEGKVVVTSSSETYVDIAGYTTSDPANFAVCGYIYINEVGQNNYHAKPGEEVTFIPVAAPGYKFVGFEWANPESLLEMLPKEAPYTITVPEGIYYIMLRGAFVKDEENPSYVVHAYQAYVDGYEISNISSSAFVMLETLDGSVQASEMLVAEGDQIKLLCYVENATLQCQHFCLYAEPRTVIPEIYTVSGKDANERGIIEISAYVTRSTGVDAVADGTGLSYDRATMTINADEDVRIFTIGGQLIKSCKAGQTDLSDLPEGLYIATTASKTIKFAR